MSHSCYVKGVKGFLADPSYIPSWAVKFTSRLSDMRALSYRHMAAEAAGFHCIRSIEPVIRKKPLMFVARTPKISANDHFPLPEPDKSSSVVDMAGSIFMVRVFEKTSINPALTTRKPPIISRIPKGSPVSKAALPIPIITSN